MRSWREEAHEIFTQAYAAMRSHIYPLALSAPDQQQVFATLLAWRGWFYRGQNLSQAYRMVEEALELLRPLNMVLLRGDYLQAQVLAQEALAISQRSGDIHLQGVSQMNLGMAAYGLGDYAGALTALVAARENSVYIEMDIHLARVLAWLARTHLALGQPTPARDYLAQALRAVLQPKYAQSLGIVLNTAALYLADTESEQALALWRAVQQSENLYHEDRDEAARLISQNSLSDSPLPAQVDHESPPDLQFARCWPG